MTFHPFSPESGMLERVVEATRPISLEDMNAEAELMTRLDQKYFVPREVLGELLAQYRGLRVLEIAGQRSHGYASQYFDTPDFLFFRQHVQGRRHRNKVRIRTYSTGDSFLEVKAKGERGTTVKNRIPHASPTTGNDFGLDAKTREFIERQIPQLPGISQQLTPVTQTHYDRVTFLQAGIRITCDLNLELLSDTDRSIAGPNEALVETKSATGRSAIDRGLRDFGIRPVSVSKYGVGTSLLYSGLPSNPWHRVLRRYFGFTGERGARNVQNLLSKNDTGVTTTIMMS